MRRRLLRTGQYAALSVYLIFLGFPFLWMLSTSFKTRRELVTLNQSLIPKDWEFSNYTNALGRQGLIHATLNSLQISVITTLVVTLFALPAAYLLARFNTRLRALTSGWILISQVFPLTLMIIPLFMILKRIGLINTYPGLILVYLVWSLPFALWMLRGYIVAIPRELEEAAAIDGASGLMILRLIVLPLLLPGIVATALFTFISTWNEFFFVLVLIQDPEKATLPLVLARFVGAEGQVQLGPLAAASVLATIPSLLAFVLIQKRLVSGLLAGAVKG